MLSKESRPDSSSQKVLLVDDEEQMCDVLGEALTHMGHQVVTAGDGREALEKIAQNAFDIVITDINMPRMDGIELIKRLAGDRKEIDIIAITGHAMRYSYTDVVSAGASDFIIKPFTLNELEAKLTRIIRERSLRKELEHLAIRDPLTGLYNRRFFQRIVRKEALRAIRYRHPLFLFFFDIDHFKMYNDMKGHQAGDQLLVQFAELLKSCIRKDLDVAFRYGGDEFTLLLPHLLPDSAMSVADRIRQNYNLLGLTPTFLSVGIAQFIEKTGAVDGDIADMIRRADRSLYHAKHDLGGDTAFFDGEKPE
ncbi:GGDEF domain-containing response regulator [Desulforhabdus amnigena]|jgi:diguanylate cyclase (GGDEF)-like protein|uniref:diguanylate cyclase n=1 Tax=Desulforhabdus amnigena TaxID=40218 RepID=A0A9W6FRR5_9BACT|nr:diguanylate cyclase [Desulforhabdus amnigena]GLI33812.1 diguanylate cyclase response regulator [Desulforhabdus amnigena]